MLSTLLGAIQQSFGLGRAFLLGSLLPVVLFALASGAVLWTENTKVETWIKDAFGATATLSSAVTVALLLGAGYMMSSLLPFLQQILEGRYSGWIARVLPRTQYERLQSLEARLAHAARQLRRIESGLRTGVTIHRQWEDRMRKCRQQGLGKPAATYPPSSPAAVAVAALRENMAASRPIEVNAIATAVRALCRELRTKNANILPALDRDQATVLEAITYLRNMYRDEWVTLANARQFRFPTVRSRPGEPSQASVLAPTAFGNITRTVRAYALSRYGFVMDVFCTLLQ